MMHEIRWKLIYAHSSMMTIVSMAVTPTRHLPSLVPRLSPCVNYVPQMVESWVELGNISLMQSYTTACNSIYRISPYIGILPRWVSIRLHTLSLSWGHWVWVSEAMQHTTNCCKISQIHDLTDCLLVIEVLGRKTTHPHTSRVLVKRKKQQCHSRRDELHIQTECWTFFVCSIATLEKCL